MSRRHGRPRPQVLTALRAWAVGAVLAVAGAARVLAQQATGDRGGQIGSSVDGQQFSYGRGATSTGTEYRVWLVFPRSGFLFTPELVSYQAALQPVFVWQTRSALPETQRVRQLNYSVAATVLAGSPVGFGVGGANTSATSSGGAGTVRDYRQSYRNLNAWVRFRPLPLQFSVSRHHSDETWRNPGSAPLRNATVQRIARASASNSKLSLQAQRFEYDDRLRDLDYTTSSFSANHGLRWGRGSRLESGYALTDQAGVFALRRREWTERLELFHSPAVRTSSFLHRYTNGLGADRSGHTSIGTTVNVTASRVVTVGLQAHRQSTSRGATHDGLTFLAPRLGVTAGGRRLSFAGSALLGWEGRRLVGATGSVPVVDEVHVVAAIRTFVLEQPDVEPGSIVVRGSEGNVYLEGTDYRVAVVGRTTRIDLPIDGRVAVGDRLLVSYRYRAAAEGRASGVRGDLSLTLTRGGLMILHQQSVRATSRGERFDSLDRSMAAGDFNDRRTAISYRRVGRAGSLDASAALRDRTRAGNRVTETEVSLAVTRSRIGGRADGSLAVGWTGAKTDDRQQQGVNLGANVAMPLWSGFDLRITTEAARLAYSDNQRFRYLDTRTDLTWRTDRLAIELELDWYRQSRPIPRGTTRVAVRLTRAL